MAVPLSAHPSPLVVITTKLAAAILGGPLFGGGVLLAQYCPCDLNSRLVVIFVLILAKPLSETAKRKLKSRIAKSFITFKVLSSLLNSNFKLHLKKCIN